MPGPGATLAKAKLIEMEPDGDTMRCPSPGGSTGTGAAAGNAGGGNRHEVELQFNPQTLKVNYSNQSAGGEQAAGGPRQFVGTSTTKLSVELVFDISRPHGEESVADVRLLTAKILYFLTPKEPAEAAGGTSAQHVAPPGVCFSWGDFQFEGVVDSMDETIELFSSEGRALRATVSLSMSKQEILQFRGGGDALGAGQQAVRALPEGQPLQQTLAQAGQTDWQSAALASGIENPRRIARGTLLRSGPPSPASLHNLGVT